MGRRGRRGGLFGGVSEYEGVGVRKGGEGKGGGMGDGPFLSVPRGPSGAWLGTLLRSLSILGFFLFWAFFGGGDLLGISLLLLFSSSGVV